MLRFTLLFSFALFLLKGFAQEPLPRHLTEAERENLRSYFENRAVASRSNTTPPEADSLRNMAEWEEVQALTLAWGQFTYRSILKQIVRAAQNECEVIILCQNPSAVESYLLGNQAGGPLEDLENITLLDVETNSIWIRDYGPNSVYINGVDSLILVDWIYNRPRPLDDVAPAAIADYMGLELFETTSAPTDLVNTGGNFMSDGFGRGFASELILEENEAGNPYSVTPKNEEEIDDIMRDFMGIDPYIKMEMLPFDGIHHIDMHMKLLNEETLLVGEYPDGVADGPQINANLNYVLDNFVSMWEDEYKVIRIPMPPSPSGLHPDDSPPGYYRTYTNSIFINETLLVPTYREEYDTTALRIYEEVLPGYTIVPIDCDNEPDLIIAASGALHCITHTVGVADPLLIAHQELPDLAEPAENDHRVEAIISHRSGIASATLWYRVQQAGEYTAVEMQSVAGSDNLWEAHMPSQPAQTEVQYYIEAEAESGKQQVRPLG